MVIGVERGRSGEKEKVLTVSGLRHSDKEGGPVQNIGTFLFDSTDS